MSHGASCISLHSQNEYAKHSVGNKKTNIVQPQCFIHLNVGPFHCCFNSFLLWSFTHLLFLLAKNPNRTRKSGCVCVVVNNIWCAFLWQEALIENEISLYVFPMYSIIRFDMHDTTIKRLFMDCWGLYSVQQGARVCESVEDAMHNLVWHPRLRKYMQTYMESKKSMVVEKLGYL